MLGMVRRPRMSVEPGGSWRYLNHFEMRPGLTQRTRVCLVPSSRQSKTTFLAVPQMTVLVTKARKATIIHIHYFYCKEIKYLLSYLHQGDEEELPPSPNKQPGLMIELTTTEAMSGAPPLSYLHYGDERELLPSTNKQSGLD